MWCRRQNLRHERNSRRQNDHFARKRVLNVSRVRQRKGIAFKKHFSARATRPRGLPSFARRSKNTTKAVASLVFSTPPLSTVKSCDNFVGDARRKKHATRPVKRRAVAIGASFYIARREKRTSFFNRDIKAHHRVVYYVSLRGKNEGVLGPCVR